MGRKKSLNTITEEAIKKLAPYIQNLDEEKKAKVNEQLKEIRNITKGGDKK